ncbi:MAG: hypothetical protein IPI34_09445 [bacterium]|nr:hypothetical protein [bacterium]
MAQHGRDEPALLDHVGPKARHVEPLQRFVAVEVALEALAVVGAEQAEGQFPALLRGQPMAQVHGFQAAVDVEGDRRAGRDQDIRGLAPHAFAQDGFDGQARARLSTSTGAAGGAASVVSIAEPPFLPAARRGSSCRRKIRTAASSGAGAAPGGSRRASRSGC